MAKQIQGTTLCTYFYSRTGCMRGPYCHFQHGEEDPRVLCIGCQDVRCAPGHTYCEPCWEEIMRPRPAHTPCDYYLTPKGCKNGDWCHFQHGNDDVRNICRDCGNVRCGMDRAERFLVFCKTCWAEWCETHAETHCHTHHTLLSEVPATGEMYCKSCNTFKECSTKGCKNKTYMPRCEECYEYQVDYEIFPCRECGENVYPGEGHSCA